jgi:hypothetical protein
MGVCWAVESVVIGQFLALDVVISMQDDTCLSLMRLGMPYKNRLIFKVCRVFLMPPLIELLKEPHRSVIA